MHKLIEYFEFNLVKNTEFTATFLLAHSPQKK